jgi:sugar phosphate isomerase/epimerase
MAPRFGMATYCRQPLGPQLEEAIDLGFDYVELDLTGSPEVNRSILGNLEPSTTIPVQTAHLPRLERRGDTEEALALVDALAPRGVAVFNLHIPSQGGTGPGRRQVEYLADLAARTRELGASLTVENTWEDVEAVRGVLARVPDLGFCLDLGHANLASRAYRGPEFLKALGSALRLVHVSDNKGGNLDLHIPVGRGTVPFPHILGRIASMDYRGPVTLEIFRGTKGQRAESLALVKDFLQA